MRREIQKQEQQGFRLNLGEYWRVIWRKKYFLIIPVIIAAIVSNVGVRFLVPIFGASTVVRIENAGAMTQDIAQFVQSDGGRRRDAETLANIEADIKGSAFLDELIRELGMDRDPRLIMATEEQRRTLYPGISTEELVFRKLRNFLKRRIAVEREGPGLFRITYTDANPEACFIVAEAITHLYIDMQQRAKIEGLQDVSDFSEDQLAVYKERLDRSERALQTFQRQMAERTADANPVGSNNIGVSETIRNDIDLTISNSEETLQRIRQRLVQLIGRVPDGDAIFKNGEIAALSRNLTARRESELLTQLRGGVTTGPKQDIADTQQQIQRLLGTLVARLFPDVSADYRPLIVEYFYQQMDIDSYQQKQAKLKSYISAFRQNIALEPQMKAELDRLQQEVDQNRSLYNTFQNSQTRTQISEAVQNTDLAASIVVVENASRPLAPVEPNKVKILILALVFGLTLGGGGLVLTEFSDSSFRSVEEVEKELGLKVLGTVPRFESDTKWFRDNSRRRAVIWAATSVVAVCVALTGFYFYGKSVKAQLIDLKVSRANTSTQG